MKSQTAESTAAASAMMLPPMMDPSALENRKNAQGTHFLDKLNAMIKDDKRVATPQSQSKARMDLKLLQQKRLQAERDALATEKKRQAADLAEKNIRRTHGVKETAKAVKSDHLEKTAKVEHIDRTDKTDKITAVDKKQSLHKKQGLDDKSVDIQNANPNAVTDPKAALLDADKKQPSATDDKKEGEALLQRLTASSQMLGGKPLPDKDVTEVSDDDLAKLKAIADKLLNGDQPISDDELKKLQQLQAITLQHPKALGLDQAKINALNVKLVAMDVKPAPHDDASKAKLAMLIATTASMAKAAKEASTASAVPATAYKPSGLTEAGHLAGGQMSGQALHGTQLPPGVAHTALNGAPNGMNPNVMNLMQQQSLQGQAATKAGVAPAGTLVTKAALPAGGAAESGTVGAGPLAATLNQLHETQQQTKDIQAASAPLHFTKATAGDAVSERVQMMMSKNLKHIDIRLDPPDLGKLQIKLSMDQGQTSVHFLVHNAHAKEMLEQSLPRLRELFAAQGMELAHTDVEQHADTSGSGQQLADHQQAPSQGGKARGVNGANDEMTAAESITVAPKEDGVSYYA